MYEDYINLINLNKKYDFSNLQVYDVTLRDGEQTPYVAFSIEEKKNIAKILKELGFKYIEAGFPAASDDEFFSVKEIVDLNLGIDVYAFSRLNKKDIDLAINCGVKHLVLFLPGTDIHLKNKLKLSFDEALIKLKESIAYAKQKDLFVRFGCEDASRTSYEQLIKLYQAAISEGVDMVTFADTLGIMTPLSMYKVIKDLKKDLNIPLAVHCHNDYGLGLANTISAIEAGIDQVHVSLNGLGERSGNVSFEELIITLLIQFKTDLGFSTKKIYEISKKIYSIANLPTPYNKPIIGETAFQHESGIHVQGIMADVRTYQPFPPELVGRENEIILGKHSGISNVKYILSRNIDKIYSEECLTEAVSVIKKRALEKKATKKEDLIIILDELEKKYNK